MQNSCMTMILWLWTLFTNGDLQLVSYRQATLETSIELKNGIKFAESGKNGFFKQTIDYSTAFRKTEHLVGSVESVLTDYL